MRGLLAVECMYHQIVAGNKTQTRRSGGIEAVNQRVELIVDEDNHGHHKEVIVNSSDEWSLNGRFISTKEIVRELTGKSLSHCHYLFENTVGTKVWCNPRYRVGEVLYLKEPFIFFKSDKVDFWNGFAYKFGSRDGTATSDTGCELGGPDFKWKNKLFMPATAARAFIKITGIRCERLLAISDEDCIAEGLTTFDVEGKPFYEVINGPIVDNHRQTGTNSAKAAFLSLYKFANKVKTVENIWVWVYEFTYLKDYKAS